VVSLNRREFGAIAGTVLGSVVLGGGCRLAGEAAAANEGRLTARPKRTATMPASGTQPLGLDRARDAILHIPSNPSVSALPLLVLLHGAGGAGERLVRRFVPLADAAGIALLAPDSRGSTWDAIGGSFGRDVSFLDRALERTFDTVPVDPARTAVGGFSDGATYALCLGLLNGDLFRRIVAFSPGFVFDRPPHGQPRIFISHGTADSILPIDRCSRVIVPDLRRRGYDVTFREFEGGHEMPAEIARDGLAFAMS
jgi:phospholipase/carboxylesterase